MDIFDNLSAKFKYNFSKRKITLEMYNKAQLIATVFLDVQEITDEFKFVYPEEMILYILKLSTVRKS